ncbi:MAG TPA: GNAT family N-acetyltransferase, partial [Chloroflexota bacterium]|nr:GNAT family N-acetyltransferase [Chloroflexota bacterium]
SVLDLAAFDPASFGEQLAAVARAGFRLASLAELGDTPEHRRRLYELNVETARDIPGSSGQTEPFEEYARGYFERESYRPDGQWLALDEAGQWAGLSLLAWDPQRRTVLHEMTGVRRAYRGRGLALPMKVMALTCAQTWSATHALTHNDSLNAPMLAVNHRLGYQRRPGFFKMYCYDLEREVS